MHHDQTWLRPWLWGAFAALLAPPLAQGEYNSQPPGPERLNRPVMLTSKSFSWRRLKNPHHGTHEVWANHGADPDYYWIIRPAPEAGRFYLQSVPDPQVTLAVDNQAGDFALRAQSEVAGDPYSSHTWVINSAPDGTYTLSSGGFDAGLEQDPTDVEGPRATFGSGDSYHWHITPLDLLPEDTPNDLPEAFEGQTMVISSVLNPRLQLIDLNNTPALIEDGGSAAFWTVTPTASGDFVRLRSTPHPTHYLYANHLGEGKVEIWGGDDDTMAWTFEARGDGSYAIRNKLHGDLRLRANPDGSLDAGPGTGDDYGFYVTLAGDLVDGAPPVSDLPPSYIDSPLLLVNQGPDQRRIRTQLGFGDDSAWGDLGADPTYYWVPRQVGDGPWVCLENLNYPERRLSLRGDGSGEVVVREVCDRDAQWLVQGRGDGGYGLRNRGNPQLHLGQDPGGTEALVMGSGEGSDYGWILNAIQRLPDDSWNDLPEPLLDVPALITSRLAPHRQVMDDGGSVATTLGTDASTHWMIFPYEGGPFVYIQSLWDHTERLMSSATGDGSLHIGGGLDERHLWRLEYDGRQNAYLIRNRLNGDLVLQINSDGGLSLGAGDGVGDRFLITRVAELIDGEVAISDLPLSAHHTPILMVNREWSWRRIHTDHGGSDQLLTQAGADPHYYWFVVPGTDGDWVSLENWGQPGTFLAVDDGGSGEVYGAQDGGHHAQWLFEDRGDGSYRLRNRRHRHQLLEQDPSDTNIILTGEAGEHGTYGWRPIAVDPAQDDLTGDLPATALGQGVLLGSVAKGGAYIRHGGGEPYLDSQEILESVWTLEPAGSGGWVFLRNAFFPDTMLQADALGTGEVFSWGNNADNVRWLFEDRGDGSFRLRNKLYGDVCLESGAGAGDLKTSPCQPGGSAQGWTLTLAEDVAVEAYSTDPHDYDGEPIIMQARYASWARPTVSSSNSQVVESRWNEDSRSFWEIQPIDDTWFYLASSANVGDRLHVGHNGNGLTYSQAGSDHAFQFKLEVAGLGSDGAPQFFIRNRLHPDQRLYAPSENDRVQAGWREGPEAIWTFLRASELP